jgi:hypothetical protein
MSDPAQYFGRGVSKTRRRAWYGRLLNDSPGARIIEIGAPVRARPDHPIKVGGSIYLTGERQDASAELLFGRSFYRHPRNAREQNKQASAGVRPPPPSQYRPSL